MHMELVRGMPVYSLAGFHWYSLTDPGGMACVVDIGTQYPQARFEPAMATSAPKYRWHICREPEKLLI